MKLSQKQWDKLFIVHGILNKIFDFGWIEARKHGLKTLSLIREAEAIFYTLRESGKAETIVTEAAEFYRKEKFTVKEKSIGWEITI